MKKIALVGNPNSGKTTLFNVLTGSTAHVGNWPGVTVDRLSGRCSLGGEEVEIIDLPGIYSLSPYSNEEVISRNFIVDETPDCVINIVDATNLERNLYLTTQLIEMDVNVVVALNMMDLVEKNKDSINVLELSKKLGCKVVSISALREENIDTLINTAISESKPCDGRSVLLDSPLKDVILKLKGLYENEGVKSPLYHAVKLLEGDEIECGQSKHLDVVNEYKKSLNDSVFGDDVEALIADLRYKYISKNFSIHKKINNDNKETLSDKIDKVLTNRWAGIPIFLVILFLIFHLTFSTDLFYLGGLFEGVTPSFSGSEFFEGLIWSDGGIMSPGVIFQSLMIGCTDFLTSVVSGWLSGAPGWISGFICDGVLAGVFAVLSFVPQILLLFLFFSILEDSGYMARVAFILDRIFRRFGLSGRAFMPMIMGFGCSVPAMINTRTLADERERVSTIRVIPFFSCGAKLPILTAIAGALCEAFGFSNVDIITYSMYLVGMITAFVAIIIMRHTTMRGDISMFVMELPTYHLPKFKSLMLHLWDKLKHYIKKAFTIILASTIVIWFLQSFTWSFKFIEQADLVGITDEAYEELLEDEEFSKLVSDSGYADYSFGDIYSDDSSSEIVNIVFTKARETYNEEVSKEGYLDSSNSILASLGKVVQPLFTPLGFGSNLDKDNGWVFGVSAVTGLIAKENVISTFAVLSQSSSVKVISSNEGFEKLFNALIDEEGVSASLVMIENAGVTGYAVLIAFIVFNMTTIPCFAAVATAKAELPKKKLINTLVFWIVTSYVVSMICYLVLSWWWTLFIVLALSVGFGFAIHYYNKYRDNKVIA